MMLCCCIGVFIPLCREGIIFGKNTKTKQIIPIYSVVRMATLITSMDKVLNKEVVTWVATIISPNKDFVKVFS